MNQLMPKVSSVPSARQLMALRTDLACVSAPRNRTTGSVSCLIMTEPITPAGSADPCHCIGGIPMDVVARNTCSFLSLPTNHLTLLNNQWALPRIYLVVRDVKQPRAFRRVDTRETWHICPPDESPCVPPARYRNRRGGACAADPLACDRRWRAPWTGHPRLGRVSAGRRQRFAAGRGARAVCRDPRRARQSLDRPSAAFAVQ